MAQRTLGRAFMYDVSYNASEPLAPSSHEMRYKPFLGSMNLKTKRLGNGGKEVWKVVNMSGNGAMNLQRNPPVATLFPRVTNLVEYHANNQGEIWQKI
jgi:hypothetical protein